MGNITDFYNQLDTISERVVAAMVADCDMDIMDREAREIAISYIRATGEKQLEDTKRYIRAYRDFKNK